MNLETIDQMFSLKRGVLWVQDTRYFYKSNVAYQIRPDVLDWLKNHKVEYTCSTDGSHGLLHIKDRKKAILFKLTWM